MATSRSQTEYNNPPFLATFFRSPIAINFENVHLLLLFMKGGELYNNKMTIGVVILTRGTILTRVSYKSYVSVEIGRSHVVINWAEQARHYLIKTTKNYYLVRYYGVIHGVHWAFPENVFQMPLENIQVLVLYHPWKF